jgi:hypothetical protein
MLPDPDARLGDFARSWPDVVKVHPDERRSSRIVSTSSPSTIASMFPTRTPSSVGRYA